MIRWPIMLALLLFMVSPAWWTRLNPNQYTGGRSRNVADQQIRNASAIARMLGEFRTGISDIMMIKTERYMHSGVGYESHIGEMVQDNLKKEREEPAHQEKHEGCEHDHEHGAACEHDPEPQAGCAHDHEHHEGCRHDDEGSGSKPLIASKEQDFRSFIGHLHRKVKPYMAPGEHAAHTDGTQMLPWYRIATLSDPHHVRSYALGGYWLSRTHEDIAETFLLEGVEKNPDAFSLHLMLGQMYMKQARKNSADLFNPSPEELPAFLKAKDRFKTAANLAIKQRPPEPVDESPYWDDTAEDDTRAACRMQVLMELQYGDKQLAWARAKTYLNILGHDAILARISKAPGNNEVPAQPVPAEPQAHDHHEQQHKGHVHGPDCKH